MTNWHYARATITTPLDKWLICLTKYSLVYKDMRLCLSKYTLILSLVNRLWIFRNRRSGVIIGYWLDMEIYVRVLVNEYIYFHIQLITFLLHTRYYLKNFNNIYFIIYINKISKITSLLNKQKLKFKTKVNQ